MSGWSKRELALVLGLRALGDDYADIAALLNRDFEDVRSVVFKARSLCLTEGWLCDLLDRLDTRQGLAVDLPQTKSWLPRRYTAVPVVVPSPRPSAAALTAALMGDPAPGRSALNQTHTLETHHVHIKSDWHRSDCP